jgi:hypothetical protein
MAYEGEAQVYVGGDATGYRHAKPQWPHAEKFCALAKKTLGGRASVSKAEAGQDSFEVMVRFTGVNDQSHHRVFKNAFPGAEFESVDRGEKWFVPYCGEGGTAVYGKVARVFALVVVLLIGYNLVRRFVPFWLLEQ